jgi:hypothetical protein
MTGLSETLFDLTGQVAWIERFDSENFTVWFDDNVTNNADLTRPVSPIIRNPGRRPRGLKRLVDTRYAGVSV